MESGARTRAIHKRSVRKRSRSVVQIKLGLYSVIRQWFEVHVNKPGSESEEKPRQVQGQAGSATGDPKMQQHRRTYRTGYRGLMIIQQLVVQTAVFKWATGHRHLSRLACAMVRIHIDARLGTRAQCLHAFPRTLA